MAEPDFNENDLLLNDDGSVYHLNLLPKHLYDCIIVVEDPGRVNQITELFDSIEHEVNKREFVTISGTYKGKKISVISTGIGPDNIEIFFNEIDSLVNIDLNKRKLKPRKKKLNIVRIGMSSALQNDIKLGEFVATQYAIGLDNVIKYYNYNPDDYEIEIARLMSEEVDLPDDPYVAMADKTLLSLFRDGFLQGNTLTTPGFYAPQGRNGRIPVRFPRLIDQLTYFHKEKFWISNLEMETATFYAFAKMMGHRAMSVSAITDNFSKTKSVKNPSIVFKKLTKKVLEIIHSSNL